MPDASDAQIEREHAHIMLTLAPARVLPENVVMIKVLCDTGADTNLSANREARRHAVRHRPGGMQLTGLGGVAVGDGMIDLFAAPVGWRSAHAYSAHDMSGSAHDGVVINVASHKGLVRDFGARVRYEDEMEVVSARGCVSVLTDEEDVYWLYMIVGSKPRAVARASLAMSQELVAPTSDAGLIMAVMAAVARARVGDPRHLKAARYGVDAEQLLGLAKMIDGLDITSMPRESAILINSDVALRRSRHVRPASAASISPTRLILLPAGHTIASDVVQCATRCMISGAQYIFLNVCVTGEQDHSGTGFMYAAPTVEHTEEDWHDNWAMVVLAEQVYQHEVKRIIVDCESCVRDAACCRRLSLRLRCLVEHAGGDDHEKIGEMEGMVKTIRRRTEMAMYRAKSCAEPVPDGMLCKCMLYQASLLNCVNKAGMRMTRTQAHTRIAPSERSVPRPLFWADCSVHTIGQQAGPKGLMTDAKSSHERLGRLIGISHATDGRPFAELYSLDTHRTITRDPKSLLTLDEQVMLNAGVALGVAVADAATQVQLDELPELTLTAPAVRAPAVREVTKVVVPGEQLPSVGDGVRVLWRDSQGDTYKWHEGVCTDVDHTPPPRHRIKYSDTSLWHDLAKDLSTGLHPWVKLTPPAAPPPAVAAPTAAPAHATDRVTRAQAQQQALSNVHVATSAAMQLGQAAGAAADIGGSAAGVLLHPALRHESKVAARVRMRNIWSVLERMDTALEASRDPARVHDALVDEAFGDAGDAFTTAMCGGSLDLARARLYATVRDATDNDPLCAAATAMLIMTAAGANSDAVEIASENGATNIMRTPRTCKQMLSLPDCVEWLLAARDAIEHSILSLPGNYLVSETEGAKMQRELGLDIAEMVSTCKYKLDERRRLIKRKVRHSWDEARQLRAATGDKRTMILQRAAYTMPLGDSEQSCLLATATPDDYFTLADWKDAYGLGQCLRGVRLVRPPKELDIRTELGEPALLAIVTSLWGERAAGFEWEHTRDMHMSRCGSGSARSTRRRCSTAATTVQASSSTTCCCARAEAPRRPSR